MLVETPSPSHSNAFFQLQISLQKLYHPVLILLRRHCQAQEQQLDPSRPPRRLLLRAGYPASASRFHQ